MTGLRAWRGGWSDLRTSKSLKLRKSRPIPSLCKEGCSHCCHQQVRATVPEVLAVAAYIKETWSQAAIDELLTRIEGYVPTAQAFARHQTSQPSYEVCPLLENHRCSVWEARPLVCRGYNSVDVSCCLRWRQDHVTTIPQLMTQRVSSDAIQDGMAVAIKRLPRSPEACDLILGLQIALTVPDAGTRFAEGDTLFEPAAAELD